MNELKKYLIMLLVINVAEIFFFLGDDALSPFAILSLIVIFYMFRSMKK